MTSINHITGDPIAAASLCGRVILSVVFAVAAIAKLVDRQGSRAAFVDFGIPAALVQPLAWVLPAFELALSVSLLSSRFVNIGAIGALFLLITFTIAIIATLIRGRAPRCGCFGSASLKPVGWRNVATNTLLASCAGFVAASRAHNDVTGALVFAETAVSDQRFVATVLSGTVAAVIAIMFLVFQVLRQHGRLLLRLDRIEQHLAAAGEFGKPALPIGSAAPHFELATVEGATVGLDSLRAGGPLFVIFVDLNCAACNSLLSEISQWQTSYTGTIKIVVIGRGQSNEIAREMPPYIFLQKNGVDVFDRYAIGITPAAVLINADGTVGSDVRAGEFEITRLLLSLTGTGVAYSETT